MCLVCSEINQITVQRHHQKPGDAENKLAVFGDGQHRFQILATLLLFDFEQIISHLWTPLSCPINYK
jgi:hypothetical protein